MSFLNVALPFSAVLFAAEAFGFMLAGAVRPLLGLGAVAAFAVVFKPLLSGLLRAALLAIKPRQPIEIRNQCRRLAEARSMQRMAREFDDTQPGLAAELRWLASRD
jgi:hypothetical protein